MSKPLSCELLQKAFDLGTAEQQRNLFTLVAAKAEALETARGGVKPIILVDGREYEWPTKEEIARSVKAGFPVIRVHFVATKHGPTIGRDSLEPA